MKTRRAEPRDAPAIAEIYNEGIADRIATFETEPRTSADILKWFEVPCSKIVVLDDNEHVVAFAYAGNYRPRQCYSGISEFSVYVRRSAQGRGVGVVAMEAFIAAAREDGYWKLVSRIFAHNHASLKLMKRMGFREVGTYYKHAKLDGQWIDCVIVELLIEENL